MRLSILLLFIAHYSFGQHTLINIGGNNAFEIGGQYATSGSSLVGIWGAYNGAFRGELSIDKYTNSFDFGTFIGARLTAPILKQNESLPVNVLGDLKYDRFQISGASSTTYFGGGVVNHQIHNNDMIISPFAGLGYLKYMGGGDLKWSIGCDVQINKIVVGLEYGRANISGTTYINIGYKFGSGVSGERHSPTMDEMLEVEQQQHLVEQEQADAERLRQEMAQVDSLNSELELEAQLKREEEAANQRLAEIEENFKKQEEEAARVLEERQEREIQERAAEEAELRENKLKEELKKNQNQLGQDENRNQEVDPEIYNTENASEKSRSIIISSNDDSRFSVQFFASAFWNKTFGNLSHLDNIIVEKVEGRELYRYKLGYFNNRAEAERMARELKSIGYPGSFVKEEN